LRAPAKINNPSNRHLKVLVAPLDWGLGHATRCIPIIKELKNQRFEIIIAAGAAQKALLQEEFPSLTFVELPGYRIKYGKNRAFTVLRLILSIPKILICIKQENAWLRRFAARECPDLVISDNRYGLALPGIFCVFVTHQLRIRTPFGPWADRFLQRMNYRAIRGFSRCWVPDEEGEGGLAGELSHPRQMPPIPVRYIGWLSRFDGDSGEAGDRTAGPGLLVLLSGPEPQRSILEGKILEQAGSDVGRMVVVRGLPGGGRPIGPRIMCLRGQVTVQSWIWRGLAGRLSTFRPLVNRSRNIWEELWQGKDGGYAGRSGGFPCRRRWKSDGGSRTAPRRQGGASGPTVAPGGGR
jgi:hypothetical protein